MNYLKITDIERYNVAFALSNEVWKIVIKWDYLAQRTVGIQFITAIDSISANIAEGFGRYFKKDKTKFYYYSRGSVIESFDWLEKCRQQNLITIQQYEYLKNELDKLPKLINGLIKYTNSKLIV